MTLLDSPLNRSEQTPKQHSSFYNPRNVSDSDSSSDEDDYLRDQSPELTESDNPGFRSRSRSLKGYIAPRRWPDRIKGSTSSGSSGMGTSGSNSTTSLPGQHDSTNGRQGSPEYTGSGAARGSMSDVGSEDIPMRNLSVSRTERLDSRTLSPFV
jgi:hypothetical protein